MSARFDRFRVLTPECSRLIFLYSVSATAAVTLFSFGPCFQPGWANGWPLGISKHAVFATFVSLILGFTLFASGLGIFALLGAGVQYVLRRDYSGWTFLAVAIVVWFSIVTWLCARLHPMFRAGIAREWP